MSVRASRLLLFLLLFLTAPLPMAGPFDALAPPVRYVLLFGAAGAVAATEGAAGPVPGLVALLGAHAIAGLVLAWLGAWLAGRALADLAPRHRAMAVLLVSVACLVVASLGEPYRTPFGRTPSAGLLGVLG